MRACVCLSVTQERLFLFHDGFFSVKVEFFSATKVFSVLSSFCAFVVQPQRTCFTSERNRGNSDSKVEKVVGGGGDRTE